VEQPTIVPIYEDGDKTNCCNFRGMSLSRTTYKTLSNFLLSDLTVHVNEIIGDCQCGFRRSSWTSGQIFSISQTLDKKWEYNSKVPIGKNLCDSFPIPNGLKERNVLCPLLLSFDLVYAIGKVQENQERLEFGGTHQLLVYAGNINISTKS